MTDTTETRVSERADNDLLRKEAEVVAGHLRELGDTYQGSVVAEAVKRLATLERQRDVLLEAAKEARKVSRVGQVSTAIDQLDAAIAQVEGEQ